MSFKSVAPKYVLTEEAKKKLFGGAAPAEQKAEDHAPERRKRGEANELPSQAYLRARLDYSPETGLFVWKPIEAHTMWDRTWNTRFAGKVAGWMDARGYVYITINKVDYLAHRLAWAYAHGSLQTNVEIDHIDRNKSNNRLANLRISNPQQNIKNASLRSDNSSGVCGVYWALARKKWVAQIGINNKYFNLGGFEKKEDAIAARKAAERAYGYSDGHGQPRPQPKLALR
jgi:hypothetical protein